MTSVSATRGAAVESPPASYTIMGREVRLPVEVRDASAAVAYYLVRAGAAQRLIGPTGLRVVSVLPGRALCTIGTMDYKDGDLGRYHEIAVTFFVREPGARAVPFLGAAVGMLRGTIGSYIHTLPVDGEFTCEAGRTIWGFPKFVTEIAVWADDDMQVAMLNVRGELVLRQAIRTRGARAFGERSQLSYSYRDGIVYKTMAVMSGEGVGARLGGGSLELGRPPLAEELRALGLPKRPFFTTYISKMSGRFYAAERLT